METIQVVLDAPLLRAADKAATKLKVNRSALVRAALRDHLRRLERLDREAADRAGYQQQADDPRDLSAWEGVAAWPDD